MNKKHATRKSTHRVKKLTRFVPSKSAPAFVPVVQPYFEVEVDKKVEFRSDDRLAVIKRANTFAKAGKQVTVAFVGRVLIGSAAPDFLLSDKAFYSYIPSKKEEV